ncbi:MAG TPA: PrsW family glutamic-type intramembrane protease [Armatimonadota bacterium]|nr:PrsW family glutamic-type intramembrane protease [Armatimonadota bacterium]
MGCYPHPLFTSMTGIGLGWARQSDNAAVKWLAPPVGFGLAMFLHFAWNGSASLGAVFFLTYLLIMVPALIAVLVLVHYSLKHEGSVVREHLHPDVRNGLLTDGELATLSSPSARTRAAWSAYTSGGLGAWRAQNRFHQMASEVAFHRHRIARGHAKRDEDAAELEGEYVRHLQARQRLSG